QCKADDGEAHQRKRNDHRGFAADAVAESTDHDCADRSRQKAGAERRERREESRSRTFTRIKRPGDVDSKVRKRQEDVELEAVADEDGHDMPERNTAARLDRVLAAHRSPPTRLMSGRATLPNTTRAMSAMPAPSIMMTPRFTVIGTETGG